MDVIEVRLADCPTDVLVRLVDHGPHTFEALWAAVEDEILAGTRVKRATQKILRALGLLFDLGYVAADYSHCPCLWSATTKGVAAVRAARAKAATS